MIRISRPEIIELNAQMIGNLTTDTERRNYVLDNTSFFVNDTRLQNLELRVYFETGVRPEGFSIYFFQQIAKSQIEPFELTFHHENPVIIRVKEPEFWKNNPLYVDRIGFLANRMTGNCRIRVEAFRIM